MTFELKERDASGRICKFTTSHGTVTTPTLLPVINPNKMLIPPKEMRKRFGTEIIITNSYIISKDDRLRSQALEHGVHHLVDFDGPIMTDSGTFQSYVYGDVTVDPLEIVRFQRDIGSDIGTILDVFGTPRQTQAEAERGVKETIKRAKQSVPEKGEMLLACTVQGSVYPVLREYCAHKLSALDADFFPIGGVVPLMENQRYSDLVRCILASKRGLNPSKPVHLFGAGHPLVFPLAVALGCDFFDSSAYAKYAADGRLIFAWGTEKLDELSELPCCCPVCSHYTAAELRVLEAKERTLQLALHNLYVSFAEIKKIKAAIAGGWLWELVEQQATANPAVLDALRELEKPRNLTWLEQQEPTSKKTALFYTGRHTIHRPTLYRYHTRLLRRYHPSYSKTVILPEGNKPYSVFYAKEIRSILMKRDAQFLVRSHLGPVPVELDEMYPLAQSVFPETVDQETAQYVNALFEKYVRNRTILDFHKANKKITTKRTRKEPLNMDLLRISAVADMQFGKGAARALFSGELSIVKSKKTGKIRTVFCNGDHILSMRAEDGLFTLKIAGGRRLLRSFKRPSLRVVIADDAVPFVREGKSVFPQFVREADPSLRPFDECLIVDHQDHLVAVGRALLTRTEMQAFRHGVAVKTRESEQ
ncbi:MAG TPA: tRNA guanosine(15) transglycosylase TgtA [Candidatus Thermoplasmatota archaeon]|nr:tRNA guanosine(15) transglycosylase TgtA [Candidatus Thermoplasmatota archaeon]